MMSISTQLAQIKRNPFLRDQNSRIFSGLIAASRCAEWLENEGYCIEKIDVGECAMPIIKIMASAKCMELKRRWAAYSIGWDSRSCARADNWVAEIFGCRIKWQERGH
ncbi:MAG: hypothetical protein WC073_10965 [Sterolibacterium sp.]